MSLSFYNNPDLADGFGATAGRSRPHRGLDFPHRTGVGIPSVAGGVVVVRNTVELAAWTPADGARAYCIADSMEYVRLSGGWQVGAVGAMRYLGLMSQDTGALANTWADVPGLSLTVKSNGGRFRLQCGGELVNGSSGTWRQAGIRFLQGTTPVGPVEANLSIPYPAAGSHSVAVNRVETTAKVPAGDTVTFKVQGIASIAAAVVPKLRFEVWEVSAIA